MREGSAEVGGSYSGSLRIPCCEIMLTLIPRNWTILMDDVEGNELVEDGFGRIRR